MKIIALPIAVVLHGGVASAASPSSQLRRNAQEIPEVAATATATATISGMIGVDAVDMVMGPECMMMCEVSCAVPTSSDLDFSNDDATLANLASYVLSPFSTIPTRAK